MKHYFTRILVLLVALSFITSAIPIIPDADAKSKSSSSRSYSSSSRSSSKSYSSSSRSSTKSSWGSSSKKSTTKAKPTWSAKESGSASKAAFGKRNGGGKYSANKTTAKAKTVQKPTGSKVTKKTTSKSSQALVAKANKQKQSKASLTKYKAEKAKYKKPAKKIDTKKAYANPSVAKARANTTNYTTYTTNRTNYYSNAGYSRPSYAYRYSPSYGYYSSDYIWMSVGNSLYYDSFYHHRYDPWYSTWRQEAQQEAKENKELRAQLAAIDAKMNKLELANTPIQKDYIPAGIPIEMAMDPELMAPTTPTLRIATGNVEFNYHTFGKLVKHHLGDNVQVTLVPTSGTMENLRLLKSGDVDAIMAQSNGIKLYEKENNTSIGAEQFAVYPEPIQIVASSDSSIDSVSDINEDNTVIPGPRGSGTDKTWQDLGDMDSDYKAIRKMNMDYGAALKQVKSNSNNVMIIVAGLQTGFMKKVEAEAKSSNLKLVPCDDFGFFDLDDVTDKNGNEIYSVVTIPSTTYPNLQAGAYFGTNDIDSLAVDAIFMLSDNWVATNGEDATDKVSAALLTAQPQMLAKVGLLDK